MAAPLSVGRRDSLLERLGSARSSRRGSLPLRRRASTISSLASDRLSDLQTQVEKLSRENSSLQRENEEAMSELRNLLLENAAKEASLTSARLAALEEADARHEAEDEANMVRHRKAVEELWRMKSKLQQSEGKRSVQRERAASALSAANSLRLLQAYFDKLQRRLATSHATSSMHSTIDVASQAPSTDQLVESPDGGSLRNWDGTPLVGLIVSTDGKTVQGPDGRILCGPDGKPVQVKEDGQLFTARGELVCVAMIGDGTALAMVQRYWKDGRAVMLRNGRCLFSDGQGRCRTEEGQLVETVGGRPLVSADGRVVIHPRGGERLELEDGTPVVTAPDGKPVLWPDGSAVIVGQDRVTVIGMDGRVVLGPGNRPLSLAPDGRVCDAEGLAVDLSALVPPVDEGVVVGIDGSPIEGVRLGADGKTVIGPDGRVVMLTPDVALEVGNDRCPRDHDGKPVRVVVRHGTAVALVPITDITGTPVTLRNGSALYTDAAGATRTEAADLVEMRNGLPCVARDGRVVVRSSPTSLPELEDGTSVAVDQSGNPIVWADGTAAIVGADGRTVLGPDGRVVRGEDGRPVTLDASTGRPCSADGKWVSLVGETVSNPPSTATSGGSGHHPAVDLIHEAITTGDSATIPRLLEAVDTPEGWGALQKAYSLRHGDYLVPAIRGLLTSRELECCRWVGSGGSTAPSTPGLPPSPLADPVLPQSRYSTPLEGVLTPLEGVLNPRGTLTTLDDLVRHALPSMPSKASATETVATATKGSSPLLQHVSQGCSPPRTTTAAAATSTTPPRPTDTRGVSPLETTENRACSPRRPRTASRGCSPLETTDSVACSPRRAPPTATTACGPQEPNTASRGCSPQEPPDTTTRGCSPQEPNTTTRGCSPQEPDTTTRGCSPQEPNTTTQACSPHRIFASSGTSPADPIPGTSRGSSPLSTPHNPTVTSGCNPDRPTTTSRGCSPVEAKESVGCSPQRVDTQSRGCSAAGAPTTTRGSSPHGPDTVNRGSSPQESTTSRGCSPLGPPKVSRASSPLRHVSHTASGTSPPRYVSRGSSPSYEDHPCDIAYHLHEALRRRDAEAVHRHLGMVCTPTAWRETLWHFQHLFPATHHGSLREALAAELGSDGSAACVGLLHSRGIDYEIDAGSWCHHLTFHEDPGGLAEELAKVLYGRPVEEAVLGLIAEMATQEVVNDVRGHFEAAHREDLWVVVERVCSGRVLSRCVEILEGKGVVWKQVTDPKGVVVPGVAISLSDGRTVLDLKGRVVVGADSRPVTVNQQGVLNPTENGHPTYILPGPIAVVPWKGLFVDSSRTVYTASGIPLVRHRKDLLRSSRGKLVGLVDGRLIEVDGHPVVSLSGSPTVPLVWKNGTAAVVASDLVTLLGPDNKVVVGSSGAPYETKEGVVPSGAAFVETDEGRVVEMRPASGNLFESPLGGLYARSGKRAEVVGGKVVCGAGELEDGTPVVRTRGDAVATWSSGAPILAPNGIVAGPRGEVVRDHDGNLLLRGEDGRVVTPEGHPITLLDEGKEVVVLYHLSDKGLCVDHNGTPRLADGRKVVMGTVGPLQSSDKQKVVALGGGKFALEDGRPVLSRNGNALVWRATGTVATVSVADRQTVIGPDGRAIIAPSGLPVLYLDGKPCDGDGVVYDITEDGLENSIRSEEEEYRRRRSELEGLEAALGKEVERLQADLLSTQNDLNAATGRARRLIGAQWVTERDELHDRMEVAAEEDLDRQRLVAWLLHRLLERPKPRTPSVASLLPQKKETPRKSPPRVPSSASSTRSSEAVSLPLPRYRSTGASTPTQGITSSAPSTPASRTREVKQPSSLRRMSAPAEPERPRDLPRDIPQSLKPPLDPTDWLRTGETVALAPGGFRGGSLRADETGLIIECDYWCEMPYLVKGPREDSHWYRRTDVVPIHVAARSPSFTPKQSRPPVALFPDDTLPELVVDDGSPMRTFVPPEDIGLAELVVPP